MPLRAKRLFHAALLLGSCELAVDPAFALADISVERSVVIAAPADTVWSRFGGFCAVADWDRAFSECHFVKGQGEVGTIRHIERRGGGVPIVEELTSKSGTSYSYRATDGSSEGTLIMRLGPRADTTLVTWRIAAGPAASDTFREALRSRLGPAVQVALETLARMVGDAPSSSGD